MVLKKRDVEKQLQGKLECELDDKKHKVFSVVEGGKVLAVTHTSHGPDEDLGDTLLKKMAGQLGVSKATFVEVVRCTKSRTDYIKEINGQ